MFAEPAEFVSCIFNKVDLSYRCSTKDAPANGPESAFMGVECLCGTQAAVLMVAYVATAIAFP